MPFKFRLKSIMRHREFLLREAQGTLGAAVSVKMRIQSEIERLSEIIRLESEQFEQEQGNGIETARYLYIKNRLSILERELHLLYRKLERASAEVEKQRQAMIECDKSVKTLESIETRDRELYRLVQNREEQKKLDDVAASVYRNRSGKGEEP